MNKLKHYISVSLILLIVCTFNNSIYAIYKIPKDLQKEVAQNKALFDSNPNSKDARFNLAMSYAYTGQIQSGWDTLKKLPKSYANTVLDTYTPLEKQDPTNWKYPFKLAFGYYFEKDKQNAISSFKRVLDIDPNNVWAMGFIALIKGEQKKYDEAISLCKKALSIEPDATAIHFLLAEAYRKKGKYFKFLKHMFKVGRLQSQEKKALKA